MYFYSPKGFEHLRWRITTFGLSELFRWTLFVKPVDTIRSKEKNMIFWGSDQYDFLSQPTENSYSTSCSIKLFLFILATKSMRDCCFPQKIMTFLVTKRNSLHSSNIISTTVFRCWLEYFVVLVELDCGSKN